MGRQGWGGRDGAAGMRRLGSGGEKARLLRALRPFSPRPATAFPLLRTVRLRAPGGRLALGAIGDCRHQCLACGALGDTCPLPLPSPPTASDRWRLPSRSVRAGDQEGGGAPGMERWFLRRPGTCPPAGPECPLCPRETLWQPSPGLPRGKPKSKGRRLGGF